MRRRLIILAVSFLALVMVAAGGAGFWLIKNRGGRAHQHAEEAYARSDWPEAMRQYGWYLVRQPDDQEAWSKYADACEKVIQDRQRALRSAAQAYRRIAILLEDDPEAALEAAKKAAQFCADHQLWTDLRDFSNNFQTRYRSAKEDPDSLETSGAPFLIWEALAEERLGSDESSPRLTESARENYEKAISLGYDSPQVYGGLARILRQQRFPELALNRLNTGLAQFSNDPMMRVERARFFLDEERLDEAEREIQEALNSGADDPELLRTAAKLQLDRNNWEGAEELATRAMEHGPDRESIVILVQVYSKQNAIERTAELLESLDPYFIADHYDLYLCLAETQIELGRYEDSNETLRTYRQAYPEQLPMFEYLEAQTLLRQAENPEASGYFEKVNTALGKLRIVTRQVPNFRPAQLKLIIAYLRAASYEKSDQRNELKATARSLLLTYLDSNPGDQQGRELWKQFFEEPTLEGARADASAILDDPNVSAQAKVRQAERLESAAARKGERLEDDDKLVRGLLEQAYAQNPSDSNIFEALMRDYLRTGDEASIEKARAAVARAQEDQVEGHILRVATASLAMAKPEDAAAVEEALVELMKDLANADLSQEDLADWTAEFVKYGRGERYVAALEQFLSDELDENRRLLLQNELVRALRLTKRLDLAFERAREFAPSVRDHMSEWETLLDEVCATVEDRLRFGETEERPQQAIDALNWVLDEDPGNKRALKITALVRLGEANYRAAEDILRDLRKTSPEDSGVWSLSAEVARQRGEPNLQLDYMLEATSVSPLDPELQLGLAQAYVGRGEYERATTILEGIRTSRSGDGRFLDTLARSYAGADRFSEAATVIRRLETMTVAGPKRDRALASLRAWLAFCRKDWPEVEQLASENWQGTPADFGMLRMLKVALVEQDRRPEAEQLLVDAAANIESPESYTELGKWYLAKGDRDSVNAASSWFTRAQVLSPGYPPAILGMIELETQQNNLPQAIGICDAYLRTLPDNVDILQRKALLLASSQRLDEAVSTFSSAIAIAERPELFFSRGSIYLLMDRAEESIQDLERSIELSGETPAAVDVALAEAYLALSDPDFSRARTHYEAAVRKRDSGQSVDPQRLESIAARLAEESA